MVNKKVMAESQQIFGGQIGGQGCIMVVETRRRIDLVDEFQRCSKDTLSLRIFGKYNDIGISRYLLPITS